MVDHTSRSARETVTAFFETRTAATAALDRLRNDGVPVDEAQMHDDEAAATDADRDSRRKGFLQSLGDLFLPHEDRDVYAEGLSRGGTLLTLPVSAGDRARAVAILDDEGTVDLDERQVHWRNDGWGGPATSPMLGDTGLSAPRDDVALRSGISGIGAHAAGTPPARFASRSRDIEGGRVRSYRLDETAGETARTSDIEVEDRREVDDLGAGVVRRSL